MIKRILAALALAFALTGATGSPVYATEKPAPWKCAAYVFKGTDVSLCTKFPGDADRDCKQIGQPVALVKKGTDPWLLDRDGDGFGCDKPKPGPSGSASPSASASASPSASASASASPSASVSTSASASTPPTVPPTTPPATETTSVPPPSGDELPLTGPTTAIAVGVGALLLTGGVVVLLAQRRRRTRFTA